MISDRTVLVAASLGLAACAADVPVIEVRGEPRRGVTLRPPPDLQTDELISYRWDLVRAPDSSQSAAPAVDTPDASFTPDRRGSYLVDRWIEAGLADDLTHHFVITVDGLAPIARVLGYPTVTAGQPADLDGQPSDSPEGYRLSYQWRLAARPEGSRTTLPIADRAQMQFTPDVPGDYALELAVFDGELWSLRPATGTVRATAP